MSFVKMDNLHRPCGVLKEHGARVLRALNRRALPVPLTRWPDQDNHNKSHIEITNFQNSIQFPLPPSLSEPLVEDMEEENDLSQFEDHIFNNFQNQINQIEASGYNPN